ncbi:hypothetical protein R1flu_026429 [Riccia fluitans]|uniref:VWFA domain-containing protein n=1 Tax=Riccia fluitans TaxID=41844 RepID=A0ABD1XIX0_9MARC
MFPSRAVPLIFVFCAIWEWNWNHVNGQALTSGRTLLEVQTTDDANAFFDEVQTSVITLAGFALSNYRRRQGLWESGACNARCSVSSCQTEQLDENNWHCLALPADSTFLSNQSCKLSPRDYAPCRKAALSKESYVRLPGIEVNLDPRNISPDQQLTICSQKDLDQQIFPKIYPNSTVRFDKIAWSMFGASNGVFRIYPGLELPPTICQQSSYDPRKRPWYRAITGVSKQVVIMLDQGGSMANTVSNTDTTTLFDATVKIIVEFLDTLNTGDTVSVYTFGSTGPVNVLPNNGKVKMPDTSNESAVTEALAPLKAAMQALSVTFDAAPANLTAALENLLSSDRGFNTSSALVKSLKVILIFTEGKLLEGPTLSIPSNSSIVQALTALSVRPFIYQWKKDQSESKDQTFTDLQSASCALNAYYDEIPRDNILEDLLSALQSFYSYVAKIRHKKVQEKPLWIPSYGPYTGVGNIGVGFQVMAVSYPVFDGDFLVGVAAIDVLRNLGPPWEGVINARKDPDIVTDLGPSLNCTASLSPADVAVPGLGNSNGGLCLGSTLAAKDYEKRTCCNSQCIASGSKPSPGEIVGICIGSLFGLLLVVFLIALLVSRRFRTATSKFFQYYKNYIQRTFRLGNGGTQPETETTKTEIDWVKRDDQIPVN